MNGLISWNVEGHLPLLVLITGSSNLVFVDQSRPLSADTLENGQFMLAAHEWLFGRRSYLKVRIPVVGFGTGLESLGFGLSSMLSVREKLGSAQLQRFKNHVAAGQGKILSELDDLRSLFAHNFAGVADRKYLTHSRRSCLKLSQRYRLSCGYQFNGQEDECIKLALSDLKYYISQARKILACLNK